MSEENWTPDSQLVEVSVVHELGESASEGEDKLHSQMLDRRLSSPEANRRIKAIVTP